MALDLDREQDIEELRRIAQAQQAQIQQLLDLVAAKSREIERLRGNPGDMQLTLKMLEALQAKAKAATDAVARAEAEQKRRAEERERKQRAERSTTGPTPQPLLPVIEHVFTLDDVDRACPSCGGELREMVGQFEESELIDVIEVRYELVRVKQQKYVCRCGSCVETALGPERVTPGSRYSLAFAIKVVLDKWLDHIPLERQCRILGRHGLVVTSQTLWDLANALAHRLKRLDAALATAVLEQPVIGRDQTGWPRLETAGSKPLQMWCLTAPGIVVHRIRDDKSAATFTDLVGDYTGTIVCDALATHGAGARASPGVKLAGCWAHYPESVVIPSWLPGPDEKSVRSLKIIRATVLGASASISRGSTITADAPRRPRAIGHRCLASRLAGSGDDRGVPRVGPALAQVLGRPFHRRRATSDSSRRRRIHLEARWTAPAQAHQPDKPGDCG